MVLLLLLYLRWLAVAAWRIALFVRLAQRYARYLLAVEQPAAGTVEILIVLGDINRDVEHDGGRLRKAVGVGLCGQGYKGDEDKCETWKFHWQNVLATNSPMER